MSSGCHSAKLLSITVGDSLVAMITDHRIMAGSVCSANFLITLHGPSMFAVKAKIYGVLYNQASSIAFDETSSYW